jgi:hypothetical protein
VREREAEEVRRRTRCRRCRLAVAAGRRSPASERDRPSLTGVGGDGRASGRCRAARTLAPAPPSSSPSSPRSPMNSLVRHDASSAASSARMNSMWRGTSAVRTPGTFAYFSTPPPPPPPPLLLLPPYTSPCSLLSGMPHRTQLGNCLRQSSSRTPPPSPPSSTTYPRRIVGHGVGGGTDGSGSSFLLFFPSPSPPSAPSRSPSSSSVHSGTGPSRQEQTARHPSPP